MRHWRGPSNRFLVWPEGEESQQGWEPTLLLSRWYSHSQSLCTSLFFPLFKNSPLHLTALSLAWLSLCHQHCPVFGWNKPPIFQELVLTVKEMALNSIRTSGRRRLMQPLIDNHPVVKIIQCPRCWGVCRHVECAKTKDQDPGGSVQQPSQCGWGRVRWDVCPQWQSSPHLPGSPDFQTNKFSCVSKTINNNPVPQEMTSFSAHFLPSCQTHHFPSILELLAHL